MLKRLIHFVSALVLLVVHSAPSAADEPKSRVEIAKLAKGATVLVEVKPGADAAGGLTPARIREMFPDFPGINPDLRLPQWNPPMPGGAFPGGAFPGGAMRYGSGFCVHPSGLFVTNAHLVNSVGTEATLVLDARLKTQKVLKAKVVRRDQRLDLALIRIEGEHKLPALALGKDIDSELTEVIAFGFPLGKDLAKEGYPEISVNTGSVSSLRRDDKGELNRIQLDNTLNRGNSGGPVLDRDGKVVGVVVSGIVGFGVTGINMAIPVSHVRQFVLPPDLQFTPPTVKKADEHKPVVFEAHALPLLPEATVDEMELMLSNGSGTQRRHAMKLVDGVFRVTAVAFPAPEGPPLFRAVVDYDNGTVTGWVEDKSFRVGAQTIKLSEVASLRPGAKASVQLHGGKSFEGELVELKTLAVRVGKQVVSLDVAGASKIAIEQPEKMIAAACTLVARQKGKELGRLTLPVYLEGAKPDIEALRGLKFVKPPRAVVPVSYLRAISSKGDFIGQGQSYSYTGDQLTIRTNDRGVQINVDGWFVNFGAPRGRFLAVGEYPDAKRYAFSGDSPGIDFSGKGRGGNRMSGKFVVWELEVQGNRVVRLALDFVQHCEEKQPPLYGMIRFNSNFE